MKSFEKDPIANDARRAKRQRQLGESLICVLCGFDHFDALIPVKRSLIENHHVVGHINDEILTVPICVRCHRIISEAQTDMGLELRKETPRPFLEKLVDILLSIADFFIRLGESFYQYAVKLMECIKQLDANMPTWRTLPGVC